MGIFERALDRYITGNYGEDSIFNDEMDEIDREMEEQQIREHVDISEIDNIEKVFAELKK